MLLKTDLKVLFHINLSAWVKAINTTVNEDMFELKQLGLIFLSCISQQVFKHSQNLDVLIPVINTKGLF